MSPDKTNISPTQTPTTVNPEDIVAEARKWLGTKWVHQGRSKAGIDCAGLLIRVGAALGLEARDKVGYKRTPDGHSFLNHIREQSDLSTAEVPGCIAVFRERHLPCHVGILSEKHGVTHVIHASMGIGSVVEEPLSHSLRENLTEVRRFRGVDY